MTNIQQPPKNVLFFISDKDLNSLYEYRTLRYLQSYNQPTASQSVGTSWIVESDLQFSTVTNAFKGFWDIFVAHLTDIQNNHLLIEEFLHKNPRTKVGVIDNSPQSSTPPFPNATMFSIPQDIDEWLAMMYQLLNQ